VKMDAMNPLLTIEEWLLIQKCDVRFELEFCLMDSTNGYCAGAEMPLGRLSRNKTRPLPAERKSPAAIRGRDLIAKASQPDCAWMAARKFRLESNTSLLC